MFIIIARAMPILPCKTKKAKREKKKNDPFLNASAVDIIQVRLSTPCRLGLVNLVLTMAPFFPPPY